MGIIVDLIIVAIIVLSTFLAYKKGLVKLAIGLCTFAISIVITLLLYQPITNLVVNVTGIDEAIENSIYEKANSIMQENKDEVTNQIVETAQNEMLPETARNLAINIVTGGVIIILFIVIKIVLRFISAIADTIAKLPILDQINKAGGMLYGILRGILVVYIALLIASISGQIDPANKVNQSINQSSLGKVMYENNLLNVFFK